MPFCAFGLHFIPNVPQSSLYGGVRCAYICVYAPIVKHTIGRGYAPVKHILSTYKALLENRIKAALGTHRPYAGYTPLPHNQYTTYDY